MLNRRRNVLFVKGREMVDNKMLPNIGIEDVYDNPLYTHRLYIDAKLIGFAKWVKREWCIANTVDGAHSVQARNPRKCAIYLWIASGAEV